MSSSYSEEKIRALESVLGPEHDMVMHAVIPYHIGGTLDLSYYLKGVPGTGIATQELIAEDGTGNVTREQKPYELVMFTRLPLDLEKARDATSSSGKLHGEITSALSLIARYGSQTALNPGDTFEYPSDAPVRERRCFLFDEYAPEGKRLVIDDRECLLLLVMEIHRSELLLARQRSTARLIELLKKSGAYPYSDMDRPAVGDLSVVEAADCWDEGPIGLGRLVPSYLQRHLASRAPDHLLTRRPDGEINVDDAPGMVFFSLQGKAQEKARGDFLRLINEQLPNRPEVLASLAPLEIVTRLCDIYGVVTGTDTYSRVCMAWCTAKKLVPANGHSTSGSPIGPAAQYYYAKAGKQSGPVSANQLRAMAATGHLQPGDLVWTQGMAQWQPATALGGLFSEAAPVPAAALLEYQNPYAGPFVANPVRPVSYTVYIGLLVGSVACLIAQTVLMLSQHGGRSAEGPVPLASLALRMLWMAQFAGLCIYVLLIMHRAWQMLPRDVARTTPGKAVGFLFIPLFNLYWLFQAIYGWSKNYNRSLAFSNREAPRASQGLFLALCILQLLSIALPMCGIIFVIAIQPIVMWQMCQAINYFARNARTASSIRPSASAG